MTFPVSVEGKFFIEHPGVSGGSTTALVEIARVVLLDEFRNAEVNESTIVSRSYFAQWFVSGNWHAMVPFDEVTLTLSPANGGVLIRYTLSTRRMFHIVSMMTVVAIAFLYPGDATNLSPIDIMELMITNLALIFGWLFGGNYALGMVRGPRWLREKLTAQAV